MTRGQEQLWTHHLVDVRRLLHHGAGRDQVGWLFEERLFSRCLNDGHSSAVPGSSHRCSAPTLNHSVLCPLARGQGQLQLRYPLNVGRPLHDVARGNHVGWLFEGQPFFRCLKIAILLLSLEAQKGVQTHVAQPRRVCPVTSGQGQLRVHFPLSVRRPLHHEAGGNQVDCLFEGRSLFRRLNNGHSSAVPENSSRRSSIYITVLVSAQCHAGRDSSGPIPAQCMKPVAPWSCHGQLFNERSFFRCLKGSHSCAVPGSSSRRSNPRIALVAALWYTGKENCGPITRPFYDACCTMELVVIRVADCSKGCRYSAV